MEFSHTAFPVFIAPVQVQMQIAVVQLPNWTAVARDILGNIVKHIFIPVFSVFLATVLGYGFYITTHFTTILLEILVQKLQY